MHTSCVDSMVVCAVAGTPDEHVTHRSTGGCGRGECNCMGVFTDLSHTVKQRFINELGSIYNNIDN